MEVYSMINDRNYASVPFREHKKIQKYASFLSSFCGPQLLKLLEFNLSVAPIIKLYLR